MSLVLAGIKKNATAFWCVVALMVLNQWVEFIRRFWYQSFQGLAWES